MSDQLWQVIRYVLLIGGGFLAGKGSCDRWGVRVAQPVPGAVAVTDRREGGHVAIVSRVEGPRVFVWNPTRDRGWREVEYTNRHARYRVAGVPR